MELDDWTLCVMLRRRACRVAIAANKAELRAINRERRIARRRLPWQNRPEVLRPVYALVGAVAALAWVWICVRFADGLARFF